MDQISDLMGGPMGGSVEQQALGMVDDVIDQAINLVVQRFPASSNQADETKRRIKEAAWQEINRLVAKGQRM